MTEDNLPTGWKVATLGQLGQWSSGGTPNTKHREYYGGNIPWVNTGDLSDGPLFDIPNRITTLGLEKSSAKVFPPHTLLIAMYGATIGKLGVLKVAAATNQACAALLPSEANLDVLRYVYFFLLFRRDHFKKIGKGGAQPNISQTVLKETIIPLAPLNEQRRIVEKIETLFARLDKGEEGLREVQKLLVRYRQSVLKAAVTGQLTADWRAENARRLEHGRDLLARILQTRRETWQGRGQYKEPTAPDTTDLPELPEGWVWASVDQLLIHLTSGSRDWKQYYGRGEGVFIMAQNVRPMRFDLSEKFMVDPPSSSPDAIRSEVKRDDVLITIVGANTGDVCRFPSDEHRHYVCQSVALLRLADTDLSSFVEMYLSGKGAGRDQLEKFIYGAGRPHLSFEQLRMVAIPLPSRDEQDEIMLRVDEAFERVKQIETICQTELARSAALRQSILKDAFGGRLVLQDPADEPAADLLIRIKETRTAAPANTRRRVTA